MAGDSGKWLKIVLAFSLAALIVLAPSPEGLTEAGKSSIGLLVLVVLLFGLEPVPLPAVALLIAIYQVALGLGDSTSVARSFMADAAFFIIGALMMAVPVTKQGIDRRIALQLLSRTGGDVRLLSVGLVTTCALVGGFVADHTVTAVMLPVALSILRITEDSVNTDMDEMGRLLLFSIAYGATIGGIFTPSGGGRNVVMLGFLQDFYGVTIGYGEWMLYVLPVTLLLIPVTAAVLNVAFRPEVKDVPVALRTLQEEREEESWTKETWLTLVIFGSTVLLWITASDIFSLGIIALGGAFTFVLFGIVDWKDYQREVDWGVVFIYMGALSLGHVLFETGAAGWLAGEFTALLGTVGIGAGAPLAMAISGMTMAMTNFMSAGATATVVGPIALEMGTVSGVSPMFMGLVTAVSAAFGFLLVLATPPLAIIYSSGRIDTKDLVMAGVLLTLAAYAVLFLVVNTWWRFLGFTP